MNLTEFIKIKLAILGNPLDGEYLQYFYGRNETIIRDKHDTFKVQSVKEAEAVLRSIIVLWMQHLNWDSWTWGVFIYRLLFSLGIEGSNFSERYLWATPDEEIAFKLHFTGEKYQLSLTNKGLSVCSIFPEEDQGFSIMLHRFKEIFSKWLLENYDVELPVLCEIKGGLLHFDQEPAIHTLKV